VHFEFDADRSYCEDLLCCDGEGISQYAELFDFRSPLKKRHEFQALYSRHLSRLLARFGERCMLHIAPDCNVDSGLEIDHVIPLSSNALNKRLRSGATSRSPDGRLKKVPTQSFGSNHPHNLVLACHNCNSLKKNAFPDGVILRRVLREIKDAYQRAGRHGDAAP